MQPHSPSFDDTTHAWQDPQDVATDTWRFAGQTTVCKSPAADKCDRRVLGDAATYLQLWASKNGTRPSTIAPPTAPFYNRKMWRKVHFARV